MSGEGESRKEMVTVGIISKCIQGPSFLFSVNPTNLTACLPILDSLYLST